jgi:hypothetical protein
MGVKEVASPSGVFHVVCGACPSRSRQANVRSQRQTTTRPKPEPCSVRLMANSRQIRRDELTVGKPDVQHAIGW